MPASKAMLTREGIVLRMHPGAPTPQPAAAAPAMPAMPADGPQPGAKPNGSGAAP